MKTKVIIMLCAVAAAISASFFMASCAEKRLPPTVALMPTNTPVNTRTPAPTKTITRTVTLTATITPTFTVTVTSTEVQYLYSFETPGDLEGWGTNYADLAFTSFNQTNSGQAYAGTGSAAVTTSFDTVSGGSNSAGGFYISLSAIMPDYSGKTITVPIWLPADMVGQPYSVQIYVWDSLYTEHDGPMYALDSGSYTPDAWNIFTYAPSGGWETSNVALGIRIFQNGAPDTADTIYFDEISIK